MSQRLLLLPLLLALGACTITFGDRERASKEVDLQHSPSSGLSTIRIDGFNGSVHVLPAEGSEITGSSRIWASGGTLAEADRRLGQMHWNLREANNTLYLELSRPDGGSNNAGANLRELYVPRGWKVDVHTSNGNVDVADGFATVLVRTSNGNLDIACDGKLRAKSSNGNIFYAGNSEDFDLDTSNGSIKVELDGDWSGRGVVDSSNGKISVRCDGRMDCELSMSTSNGRETVYGPALTSGKGRLVLDTSNANISVTHGDS